MNHKFPTVCKWASEIIPCMFTTSLYTHTQVHIQTAASSRTHQRQRSGDLHHNANMLWHIYIDEIMLVVFVHWFVHLRSTNT